MPAPAPNENSSAPVVLAAGARFFIRRITLAPDAPVENQTALALEALSPFPPEQLFHGYVVDAPRRHALIYAAYRRNFSAAEQADWDTAKVVLPDFVFWACTRRTTGRDALLHDTANTLTAIAWNDDSTLPTIVLARECTDATRSETRAQLLAELAGRTGIAPATVRTVEQPAVIGALDRDGLHIRAGKEHTAIIPADGFAQADIRDKALLAQRRREETRSTWFWRVFAATAAALAACVLLELALTGGRVLLQSHRDAIAQNVDAVKQIESAQLLATKFEKLTAQQLRPFEMLAVINAPRPRSIEFQRVGTNGPLTLQIEAQTTEAGDLRIYEDALRKLGSVERVELRDPRMRSGRTTFQIEVTFKSGWATTPGGGA